MRGGKIHFKLMMSRGYGSEAILWMRGLSFSFKTLLLTSAHGIYSNIYNNLPVLDNKHSRIFDDQHPRRLTLVTCSNGLVRPR